MYKNKYLKYKQKYLHLKYLLEGGHLKPEAIKLRKAGKSIEYILNSKSPNFNYNEDAIIYLIQENASETYKRISTDMKEKRGVSSAAVVKNPDLIVDVPRKLLDDPVFMKDILLKKSELFKHASSRLLEDKKYATEIVAFNPFSLKFFTKFQDDKDIVDAAFTKKPASLQYAKKPRILEIVSKNGDALQHASDELKGDKDIVAAAFKQKPSSLQYATKIGTLEMMKINGDALEHANITFKGDKDVVLAAVKQNGNALRHASDALKGYRDVVDAALKQEPSSLQYVTDNYSLGSDQIKFLADYIKINKKCIPSWVKDIKVTTEVNKDKSIFSSKLGKCK